MANFAILRVEKLKDKAEVVRSLKHCFREQETPNADPGRLKNNRHFAATSVDRAMAMFEEKLPAKLRKNGVLVLEYMVTASPEALAAMPSPQREEYLTDALDWLCQRHGVENIFVGTIHNDETTPHLSVFVVPKDKRGRMNARHFTGGRESLARMQTDFAENIGKRYGLVRGVEKSGARHVSIREYYRSIAIAEKQSKSVEETLATQQGIGPASKIKGNVSPEIAVAVKTNAALVAETERLKRENENLKRKVAAQASALAKVKAAEVRELSIGDVLGALGGLPVPEKTNTWDTPAGFVETDPARPRWFRIADKKIQGRGAIDLVMAIDGKTFDEAVLWLNATVLKGQPTEALKHEAGQAASERAKLKVGRALSAPDQTVPDVLKVEYSGERLERVRRYLKNDLQVSEQLVSTQIEEKGLGVACFGAHTLAAISGQDVSEEGRCWHLTDIETGKTYRRGSSQPFLLSCQHGAENADRHETAAIFTESPLDAMALYTAFERRLILPAFRALYVIATNGISFDGLRQIIREVATMARALIPAFSRDDHGRTLKGHFTRAVKEENVESDNRSVEPVPFPKNCTRWIEVLRRWREVEELREEHKKKVERQARQQLTRTGRGRDASGLGA